MFYGSIVFRFFGVLIVFILHLVFSFFTQKKFISFLDIWNGNKNDDIVNSTKSEIIYIFIGFVFVLFICWLLY